MAGAKAHVTKLAAAGRQLQAAIRMYFAGRTVRRSSLRARNPVPSIAVAIRPPAYDRVLDKPPAACGRLRLQSARGDKSTSSTYTLRSNDSCRPHGTGERTRW